MKKITSHSPAQFVIQSKIIKAMAHPTRLFIICELSRHKKCVWELTEMIGADISTVSRHLSVLKNVGIVKDEKVGANIYYKLHCPCVLNFLSCIEPVIVTQAKEHLNIIERKKKKR